ncbi:MAG TPA: hypothetical protein PLC80_01190 [Draconibacterium sp.]|nr:hypothetical protein [Draconibacterium sp.]
MKNITTLIFAIIGLITNLSFAQNLENPVFKNEERIQPWSENPQYWQYKGKPVLLLGGSRTDHIFLADGLKEHLDEIKQAGGNYVRNTMSQREPKELKAHLLLPDGKYDMDKWNPEYWTRFENMLRWTSEREIFVQIEVWDRFDFSRDNWEISPWNPACNINYSFEETGFSKEYPLHPSSDKQPFFHSIPGLPAYNSKLDLIRKYQEVFVEKMLSYSLNYGHVLYCMNNETSTPAEWGQYWINFIRSKASELGVMVFATDMFDDAHLGKKAVHTPIIFKDSEHYMFADISQINSRNFDDDHWSELLWLIQEVNKGKVRPCNHTKIYGGGYTSFGSGGLEDGIERFWRNILAGSASSRFHRPTSGNGLNDRAKACINSARLLEKEMKFWELKPHMELLSERQSNEAYLAANPGEKYALYFTNGGSVGLELPGTTQLYDLKWISITEGRIPEPTGKFKATTLQGGSVVTVAAPYKGGWVAAITKK